MPPVCHIYASNRVGIEGELVRFALSRFNNHLWMSEMELVDQRMRCGFEQRCHQVVSAMAIAFSHCDFGRMSSSEIVRGLHSIGVWQERVISGHVRSGPQDLDLWSMPVYGCQAISVSRLVFRTYTMRRHSAEVMW